MKRMMSVWVFVILMVCSVDGFGKNQLLQVNMSHQQDTTRAFSGIDGLNIQRLETKFRMPLLALGTYAGDWFSAAELTENRFNLSGAATGVRRFYRFSIPIEYELKSSSSIQQKFRYAPSYYSDESIIEQTRYVNEFSWVINYNVNRKVSWVGGVRQDTRFGVASIYPVFGLEARPNSRIHHHWVFPDIYSQVSLPKRNKVQVFAKPNGGNWRYRPAEGGEASFGMTDWSVGASWLKAIRYPWQFKVELGLKMMGEGSVAGADGSLEDGYFFLFSLHTQLLSED